MSSGSRAVQESIGEGGKIIRVGVSLSKAESKEKIKSEIKDLFHFPCLL